MGGKVVCGKNSFVICKEYAVILILFIDDFKEWWDNDHLSTRKCQVWLIIPSQTGNLREGWNRNKSAVDWATRSPNPAIHRQTNYIVYSLYLTLCDLMWPYVTLTLTSRLRNDRPCVMPMCFLHGATKEERRPIISSFKFELIAPITMTIWLLSNRLGEEKPTSFRHNGKPSPDSFPATYSLKHRPRLPWLRRCALGTL